MVVLSQHVRNSGQQIQSSHEVVQSIAMVRLVVAISSRVSRKTANSVGRGKASSRSHIARQQ